MLQSVVDSWSDGVVILDQKTRTVKYVNPSAKEILGDECDSVGEKCYLGLTHACLSCNECGRSIVFQNPKLDRVYSVTGKKIRDEGEDYILLTYHDITVRKRMEREANEQAQLLEATLEHSDLICWEYDLMTHTSYHSDRMASVLSTPMVVTMIPEEIDRLTFIMEEDRGKVQELYNRILRGEDKVEDEVRLLFENGVKRCKVMLSAIYNDMGQREKAVGMIQNVEELRGLEECFNVAAIQNEFSFFIYDVKRDEVTLYQDDRGNGKRVVQNYMNYLYTHQSAVHPDDVHYIVEGIEKAKRGSKGENRTIRWMDASSQGYKRINITFGTAFDSAYEPTKLYGTIRDVSKREQRERIYSSQLAYIESYRKSALAFAELNISKGKILNTKSKYRSLKQGIAAHTIEHWVDVLCEHVMLEEKKEELRRLLQTKKLLSDFEQGKSAFSVELPMKLSGQTDLWVSLEISLLLNPVSQDVEGFATMKDITRQQMDIEAGRTLAHMDYETVVVVDVPTESVEAVYGHQAEISNPDIQPGDSFENGATKLLQQMSDKDGKRISEFADLSKVWERLKETNAFLLSFSFFFEGKEYRKRVTLTRLNHFQEKLMVIFQDVSDIYNEEREKQRILKKALEEAKMAESAKIDFLSRMSHDLRTPLNGILGMTDIALDEVKEDVIRDYLEKIQTSGQLLLSLVNDILDISQLDDNRLKLRLEPYSMEEFLESIDRIIGNQCKSKGITFHLNFDELKGKTILTDKLRFGQIFMNLLSNAVKYTPEGGEVSFGVTTGPGVKGVRQAVFCVQDTGIGMAPEFVSQAFDAFSQERTNSIDERSGSGLGLSIVKQLVELFKGHYEVDSSVGKGTTIRVFLDLTYTEPREKKSVSEHGGLKDFEGRRVLVAEDQPLNAKIICRMLEKRGFTVELAENGRQAVEAYEKAAIGWFDAILMDVRMPEMDGIEATHRIREHKERPDCYVPIIATTANAFVEDKMMCLKAGMNEHVSKPISGKELFGCLTKYIK